MTNIFRISLLLCLLTSGCSREDAAFDTAGSVLPHYSTSPSVALNQDHELVQADMKAVQGKWVIVSAEKDGQPVPPPPDFFYRFVDSTVYTGDDVSSVELEFSLDPTVDPKWIDMAVKGSDTEIGKHIYKFDGDRLVLCLDVYAGSRPTAFKTVKDDFNSLYVLERAK